MSKQGNLAKSNKTNSTQPTADNLAFAIIERTFNELKAVGGVEPREWLVADWVIRLAKKYNVKLDDFVDACLANPRLDAEFQAEFEKRLSQRIGSDYGGLSGYINNANNRGD